MSYGDLQELGDARAWARSMLRCAPDQVAFLKGREFGDGTFGAWLKAALRQEEEEAQTLAMLEEMWNVPDDGR